MSNAVRVAIYCSKIATALSSGRQARQLAILGGRLTLLGRIP